jgi:hypothetical protein
MDSTAHFNNTYSTLKVRNIVGFVPSNANIINGWAIGWLMLDASLHKKDSILINGFYSNISPVQIYLGAMAIPYTILSPLTDVGVKELDSPDTINRGFKSRINGLSLSLLEFSESYEINGVQISAICHNTYKLQGVSITVGLSSCISFSGLALAGYLNNTRAGKGVQIGLINRANHFKGIQIGLWNKIGKRSIPFINMSFKQ